MRNGTLIFEVQCRTVALTTMSGNGLTQGAANLSQVTPTNLRTLRLGYIYTGGRAETEYSHHLEDEKTRSAVFQLW
jgi:hypothetical protein